VMRSILEPQALNIAFKACGSFSEKWL